MDLFKDRNKLFILMIVPTLIIAIILFILEFMLTAELPIISLIGFAVLIGFGAFTYFSNTNKVKESKDKKEGMRGFLIYMIPTIVISALLFTLVDPPEPPYLLVIGLVVYLIAYTVVYFLAIKAVAE